MQPEDFRTYFDMTGEMFERFEVYHKLLLKWQKAINLVSNRTLKKAWERHFADSVQLQNHIPEEANTIVDLGSGGGFPGMILAILFPEKKVHLIESDERKCEFLKNVSRETNRPVTIHNERIENIVGVLNADIISARAFASLDRIIEVTKENWLQNPTLQMVLLKGESVSQEITTAQKMYNFTYETSPSQTGNGYIVKIKEIKT